MIIIETPAPPTRERLVLVPVGAAYAHCRDATPEDLARAGWAPLAAFVGPLDMLTPPTLEGALEAIRHLADLERHAVGVAEDATREREEAIARAEKVERERDEARAELADAKNECAGAMRSAHAQYAETVRQRDTLRGELARLKAPVEGEPSGDELYATYGDHGDTDTCMRRIYRLGVAHERARQPAQDRATDEELYGLFNSTTMAFPVRAGVLAVAARVRQERCLVARAVAANVDVRVCEDNDGGFMVGVHATGCDEELARCVPASDVPATLARLLGEVTRG